MTFHSPFRTLSVLCVLIALACTLIISTYKSFGHTWDEPEHLSAGMELLDRGAYTHDIQHPPFARLAIALGPYLAGLHSFNEPGPSGEQEGREILYRSGNYDRTLTLARLGVVPFFIVMIVAVWLWAKRWFGSQQAWLACLFLISAPPVLGHAGVAALDVPGSALCVFALYWLFRWVESTSLRHALLFGLTAGLAVASKLYAIPYLAICIFALLAFGMLVTPRRVDFAQVLRRDRLLSAAVAVVTAAITLILAYGGHFETLNTPGNQLRGAVEYVLGSQGSLHDAAISLVTHVPMPLALEKLVLGIKMLEQHNIGGHFSYLLGQVSASGWWYFYPVDLAIKTPLPLLLFATAGLIWLLIRGWKLRQWLIAAPALCFFSILAFCALYSHINIGIRHVLVLYPFMAIAAAQMVVTAWQSSRRLHSHAAITALILLQASVLWTAFPDYLAYFNPIAARHPERFVVDSDLDWGQDLRRLENVIRERNIQDLWLAYRGTAALWLEHMPHYDVLYPNHPVTGWVAISLLAKEEERSGYGWLDAYVPVQRVGKSIDLYHIPSPGVP